MKRNRLHLQACVGFAALLCSATFVAAQSAPPLATAQSFAVLGGSAVTNTGASVITGDLGVSPGSAVTGFPPGLVVGGTIHAADATAGSAQTSLTNAYNDAAGRPCTLNLTGQDLGGKVLTAGVYCFSTSAQLTGLLTFDAQGDPNAVFIIQIGSTLTTASGSTVLVINGGNPCNVFWQVGSSATLGTNSSFAGNILALTSITLTTGAAVRGRTLARNGAVTLDTNTVNATCAAACPVVTLAPATLPNGTVGVAFNQTITASGGTAPFNFTVTSGALPAGLTLTSGGVIAGTPTLPGTFPFVVTVIDASGCGGTIPLTITIVSAVPMLPQAFVLLLALGLMAAGYLRLRQRMGSR